MKHTIRAQYDRQIATRICPDTDLASVVVAGGNRNVTAEVEALVQAGESTDVPKIETLPRIPLRRKRRAQLPVLHCSVDSGDDLCLPVDIDLAESCELRSHRKAREHIVTHDVRARDKPHGRVGSIRHTQVTRRDPEPVLLVIGGQPPGRALTTSTGRRSRSNEPLHVEGATGPK